MASGVERFDERSRNYLSRIRSLASTKRVLPITDKSLGIPRHYVYFSFQIPSQAWDDVYVSKYPMKTATSQRDVSKKTMEGTIWEGKL